MDFDRACELVDRAYRQLYERDGKLYLVSPVGGMDSTHYWVDHGEPSPQDATLVEGDDLATFVDRRTGAISRVPWLDGAAAVVSGMRTVHAGESVPANS